MSSHAKSETTTESISFSVVIVCDMACSLEQNISSYYCMALQGTDAFVLHLLAQQPCLHQPS